jgi:hypothetical protein
MTYRTFLYWKLAYPRRRIRRNGAVVCAGNHQGEEMKTAALYLFSFAMFTALVWLGVRAF